MNEYFFDEFDECDRSDGYEKCKQITNIYLTMSKDFVEVTKKEKIRMIAHCGDESQKIGIYRILRDAMMFKIRDESEE